MGLHDVPAGFRVIPGMPVTADIKVGKRTVLGYLLGLILPVARRRCASHDIALADTLFHDRGAIQMVVDRVIALASPRAALRRSIRLSEKGRAVEAFSLLARAAKAGIADAEYRVAHCYLEGSGVPPSRLEGGRWLQRAATHGCVEAQVMLSALCIRGLVSITSRPAGWGEDGTKRLFASEAPADPDFECAEKWARRAAQAGSAEGQALFAYVLTFGPEWMRDLEEAHRW